MFLIRCVVKNFRINWIKWPTSPIPPIPVWGGNRKRGENIVWQASSSFTSWRQELRAFFEVRKHHFGQFRTRLSCMPQGMAGVASWFLSPLELSISCSLNFWSQFKQRWNMSFTDLHYLDAIQVAIWHHQGWSSLRCMADGNAIYAIYAAYGHGWLESGIDEVIIDILKASHFHCNCEAWMGNLPCTQDIQHIQDIANSQFILICIHFLRDFTLSNINVKKRRGFFIKKVTSVPPRPTVDPRRAPSPESLEVESSESEAPEESQEPWQRDEERRQKSIFQILFWLFFFADTWCTWCIHVLIKSWRVEYLLRCFVAWGVRQERQDEEEDVEVEQPVVAEMPATAAIPQIAVLDDDGDAGDADGQDLIARDQVHQGNGCFF